MVGGSFEWAAARAVGFDQGYVGQFLEGWDPSRVNPADALLGEQSTSDYYGTRIGERLFDSLPQPGLVGGGNQRAYFMGLVEEHLRCRGD